MKNIIINRPAENTEDLVFEGDYFFDNLLHRFQMFI